MDPGWRRGLDCVQNEAGDSLEAELRASVFFGSSVRK